MPDCPVRRCVDNMRLNVSRLRWTPPVLVMVAFIFLFGTIALADRRRPFGEYLSPKSEYSAGEFVPTWAAPLTSIHTQLDQDYSDYAFCQHDKKSSSPATPSRWVSGTPLTASPFEEVRALVDVYCHEACTIENISEEQSTKLEGIVKKGYHHNFVIDTTLPSAAVGLNALTGEKQKHYAGGFPVGFIASDTHQPYMFNHLNIIVHFHRHRRSEETYSIVGFAIEPMSVHHRSSSGVGEKLTCPAQKSFHMELGMIEEFQILKPGETIVYTYDVIWKQSDISWSDRWDVYLSEDHLVPFQVHVYSMLNSVVVLTILLLIAILIWIRRIRHAAKLAPISDDEEVGDENAGANGTPGSANGRQRWRLLHGDVFRPPVASPMMLAVSCGIGAQLLSTAFLCGLLCVLGLMSQIHKLTIVLGILFSYVSVGSWTGGYVVARIFQQLQIESEGPSSTKQRVASLATATVFPGLACLFFVTMTTWARSLSSPLSFGSVIDTLVVLALWLLLFVPLSLWGSQLGFAHDMRAFPTETKDTPRDIPKRNCFMGYFCPIFSFVINGVWPFAVCYVELFFINTALWMAQCFDFYGSLSIVLLLMVATCSCVSILTTYWQLSRENHRWWWTSFQNGASTGFFILLYSPLWHQRLEATGAYGFVLYYGTMTFIAAGVACALGCVSVVSSLWFNRIIYSMITANA